MYPEFQVDFYPDEVAETMVKLSGERPEENLAQQVEDAVAYLKATAENPYNSEYFRTLYRVLEKITAKEVMPD